MPKIRQIKGHNDSSFQIDNIPRRDFSQFTNQSFSRTARKSIHDSIVPIHEVSYNPQFSKSPLANVEIQRKAHIQPIEPYPQESIYYDFKPRLQQSSLKQQKTSWKTILFRIFIILLIIGLIIGLYFLVDAILGHKFSKNSQSSNQNIGSYSSVGVAPIYFEPISYDSMSKQPTQSRKQTTSGKIESVVPQTFPSVLPSQQYSTFPSQMNTVNQAKQTQTTVSSNGLQTKTQDSSQQSISDPYQNSIPPLNVYENHPV